MQANVLVRTDEITYEEWLQHRRRGIGGSDAAAVCGLHPYKSAVDVWLEKTGRVAPPEETEEMKWGKLLEDPVAREFARRQNLKLRRRNAILQHPHHSFMVANLDRLVYSPAEGWGVLEIKTSGGWLLTEWDDRGAPEWFKIQVLHYLAVTGYEYGYIAALIGGQHLRSARLDWEDRAIRSLIEIEERFWSDYVLRDVPPPPASAEDARHVLDVLYPTSRPVTIELPEEAQQWIEEYERAHAMIAQAESLKEHAANQLRELLRDAEMGTLGPYKVRWQTIPSRRLDTQRLKAERPDIYELFAVEQVTRRFSITKSERREMKNA